MLSAIHELAELNDDPSYQATLEYLKACSKLFESGTLSHDKISECSSSVLDNIKEGYRFFKEWHQQLADSDNGMTV